MQALEANLSLRTDIRNAIDNGLPVYAECGGLMYLSRCVQWRDMTCDMVGALPLDTKMNTRPQGRGYVKLAATEDRLWGTSADENKPIHAHEFHYSSAENLEKNSQFAYRVLRGHGVDGTHDGIIFRNVQANYTHMRNVESNPWVAQFVDFVRQQKVCQQKQ